MVDSGFTGMGIITTLPSSPGGVIRSGPTIFLDSPSIMITRALSKMIVLKSPSTPVMSSSVSHTWTLTTSGVELYMVKRILNRGIN